MATAPSSTHPHENAFRGFDASIERALGADMRLIYGIAVPILMVVGLIVMFALTPGVWLVAAVLVLLAAALGVVLYGFLGVLNEDEDESPSS